MKGNSQTTKTNIDSMKQETNKTHLYTNPSSADKNTYGFSISYNEIPFVVEWQMNNPIHEFTK